MNVQRINTAADADAAYVLGKMAEADAADTEAQNHGSAYTDALKRREAANIAAGQRLILMYRQHSAPDKKVSGTHNGFKLRLKNNGIPDTTARRLMKLAGFTESQRDDAKAQERERKRAERAAKKTADEKAKADAATIGWTEAVEAILGKMPPGYGRDTLTRTAEGRDDVRLRVQAEYGKAIPARILRNGPEAQALSEAVMRCYHKDHPPEPEAIEPVEVIRREVPESLQAKFDRLLKKAEESMRATIDAEIRKRVDDRCDEIRQRMHKKEMELVSFERRLQARAQGQGFMKMEEFKLILGCLHPDRESPAERKSKAFDLFNKMQFGVADTKH